LFSPVAIKARFSFLRAKFKQGISLKKFIHLEFKLFNRALELCIFLLLFYLVSNLAFSLMNLNKKSGFEFEAKKVSPSSGIPDMSLLKVASFYIEKARMRDIFRMGLSSVVEAGQATEVPISKIAEASKILKLVGISWSEDPDVIIEDTQAKRSYFLKRGQAISDFTVKAIFKDKVVLSYQGEEFELK
ncbi:MAG: hypothetical protein KKH80_02980, partial [Candidatus Omnitrophica bacterium]|nr:hypothetical protein [Candidatus Omnitrophota bacterium]